jgi:antitoxin HigA-1
MAGMIPIHPGEILKEDILISRKISQVKLAEDINVPLSVVRGICQTKRDIDADIALRLGVYFGTSFEFWLNLQQNYDLRVCKSQEPQIKKQIHPLPISQFKTNGRTRKHV